MLKNIKYYLLILFLIIFSVNLKSNTENIINFEGDSMLDIQITEKSFWQNDVEGYVFLLKEGLYSTGQDTDFEKVEKEYYPNLRDILSKHKFTGKFGEIFVLTGTKNNKLVQFIFAGLGKLDTTWNYELENLRRTIGSVVLKLKELEIKTAVLELPADDKPFGLIRDRLIRQVVIAALMANYEFTEFKTDKEGKEKLEYKLLIYPGDKQEQTYVLGLQEGLIIGNATNFTRMLQDLPANYLNPKALAEQAKILADEHNLECKVLGVKEAQKLGMGGFLAVSSGSDNEPQFVILEYNNDKKDVPTIALVGKGVTFDSGGISLKPSDSMTGMKFDMSGAAAVYGAFKIIAQLKPNVRVIGITPLVENMPSGKACRQDDIIRFLNGKTAEIKNTDAEGRLILADALSYAEKFYSPDVIVDIATLTGACLYALGHSFTALMTLNDDIGTKLQATGLVTGDRVWPLPLDKDFKDAIKSEVADIANIGASNYKAGTITAAWFLKNFVEKAKWAHLDIAGTADGVPGVSYLGKGATGAGVRLMSEFVLNYNKNK
ncbi:MAG: putative cytosol aminopeptidase [candidate division TM6 bacterium GW2011_GWF2_28_16]|nr:MAG: putative cytosol aminopeptidase [candidate division TM6 bacterium GW2011_GWF2_28_16]